MAFRASPNTGSEWDKVYTITVVGMYQGEERTLCTMKTTIGGGPVQCTAMVDNATLAEVSWPLITSAPNYEYDQWDCSNCTVMVDGSQEYSSQFSQSFFSIFTGPFGGPETVTGIATYNDGTSTKVENLVDSKMVSLSTMYSDDLVTCAAVSTNLGTTLKALDDTAGLFWTARDTTSADGRTQLVEETAISPSRLSSDNITAVWNNKAGSLGCWAISGVNATQPFDVPSTSNSSQGLEPYVTISTQTPNDMVDAILAAPGNDTASFACHSNKLKASVAPTYAAEDVLLGSVNYTSATWTKQNLCFSLQTYSPWEVIGEAIKPQAYSTASYVANGTKAPPKGVSIRIRAIGDDSVDDAYSNDTSAVSPQTIYSWISSWKASVLERFISGYQIPAYAPFPDSTVTVSQFLDTAMANCESANPSCVMTPRLSLYEWDQGIFNITSLDLLHLPITSGMQIVSLDDWNDFSLTHTQAQVEEMFETLYAQGWQGVCVNEAGNYSTSYGFATCADIGVSSSGNTTQGWQPDRVELAGVHNETNIKYTDVFIDFPQPMRTFADNLSAPEELHILENLSSPAEEDRGFTAYMFPVEQGTPAEQPLWDSQTEYVCPGVTFYEDELLMSTNSSMAGCEDPTITTVVCSPPSIAVGESTICTATVNDTAENPITPAGSVWFASNRTGTFTLNPCVLAGAGSLAQCDTEFTPSAGSEGHLEINATYPGDGNHTASWGAITISVTKRASVTVLVCRPAVLPVDTATLCTATVSDASGGQAISPTGNVAFADDPLGHGTFNSTSCTLDSEGYCWVTYTPGAGSEGTIAINATYGGDTDHSGSSGTYDITATQRTTRTELACSPNPDPVDSTTQCTATVVDTDGGILITPTGTVTFSTNSSGVFTSDSCTLSAGSCPIGYTPRLGSIGTQNLTAVYQGDTDHFNSSGSFLLTVILRTTYSSLSCTPSDVPVNAPTICTLTVTDNDTGTQVTPTGSVVFTSSLSGFFNSTSCTLSGSGATSTCAVTYTPSPGSTGQDTLTAYYSGDSNHDGSSAQFALTVVLRSTSLKLTCPKPHVVGEVVTCTVTVEDTSPGTPITPSGDVNFKISGPGLKQKMTCTLSGGGNSSSCSVSFTPEEKGDYKVVGQFNGDANHTGSRKSKTFPVKAKGTQGAVPTPTAPNWLNPALAATPYRATRTSALGLESEATPY